MIKNLHRIEWFVGLVLIQVLVLNQLHVGGYATPFLYIYFILKFNSKIGRNSLMIWAFMLGLTVDVFGNTPGVNAAACTCLAFFRNSLLRLVTLRDLDEAFRPGIKSLGLAVFFRYILLATTLFCTLLLLIDTFTFFNLPVLFLKIVTSIVSTMVCVFCVESIGGRK
jgi:rod shape-determining protein MreD